MSRRKKFQSKRYKPTKLLGQGGMGRVVLADDLDLGRQVAIKIMTAAFRKNEGAFARFRREARIQARVEHPHVIKLYDWDLDAETPYLVMEVVQGEDLDKYLARTGLMDPAALQRLAEEVGSGMDALHREGILHRDMKPSNIMMREDGSAVVMDLGLAKAEDVTVLTQTGAMVGTPRYMPPEVFMQEQEWDRRSDQFQLGAILFEAATGEHYIPGENLQELGAALHVGTFTSFPPREPPLPEAVRAAIQRAGAYDPARRFPSCLAIAEAMAAEPGQETLELMRELEAEQAARAEAMLSGELGPRPGVPRRRGRSAALTFAALLAVGLGLGWVTARPRPEPAPGGVPAPEVPRGDAPFGVEVVAEAADEVAALGDLRIQDGRVGTQGSPLFAVRPDPMVLLQLLPRLPTAQRFHSFVAEGGPLVRVPAPSLERLRDLDRDLRGKGLPMVFHPATRGPPDPEPARLPTEEEWFRWGDDSPPGHLGGWAGQAVRDYVAATRRVVEMRRDLKLWDVERPSGFPDADLLGVNIAAATFRAKRFSREPLRLTEVAEICTDADVRRVLQPWFRDAHDHLRSLVWSLGQAARLQPAHAIPLARAWYAWGRLHAPIWTSPIWSLPIEFHLGGPLDTPGLRLLGFQLLVEMAHMNERLHFREDVLDEALRLYGIVAGDFPVGSPASVLAIHLALRLVCRQVPGADRLPGLLEEYGPLLDAAPPRDRGEMALELVRAVEYKHQRELLPPGYVDTLATRLDSMVERLDREGYGAAEDSRGAEVLGVLRARLDRFRREAASGAGG